MFRLWGKLVKDGKILKSETQERSEEDTRTHKIFNSIEEICKKWDLGIPIWLDVNISEFKKMSKTRFYPESFIDDTGFDYMEIQVLEEDR